MRKRREKRESSIEKVKTHQGYEEDKKMFNTWKIKLEDVLCSALLFHIESI